jgi:hypothetical protein
VEKHFKGIESAVGRPMPTTKPPLRCSLDLRMRSAHSLAGGKSRTGPGNLEQHLLLSKDWPEDTAAKQPEIRGCSTRTFLKNQPNERHGILCAAH